MEIKRYDNSFDPQHILQDAMTTLNNADKVEGFVLVASIEKDKERHVNTFNFGSVLLAVGLLNMAKHGIMKDFWEDENE